MVRIPQDPTLRASRGLDAEIASGSIPDGLVIVDETLLKQTNTTIPQSETGAEGVAESDMPPPQKVREMVRVLFLSYSVRIFTEGSLEQKQYAAYGELFEEVHVIVFTEDIHQFDGLQIAQNVWAYPTNSKQWWSYPYDAYKIARSQLHFADTFRADVVYAENPFELALAAYGIARRYRKTLVVEANERLYAPHFFDEHEDNGYRAWWARFVLPHADRVVVRSSRVKNLVRTHHTIAQELVDVVPSYVDTTMIANMTPRFVMKERYPQFTFTILVVAPLTKEGNTEFGINAVQHTLKQYPSMGLIIVGDGPLHEELISLVKAKSLTKQIIFESADAEYVSYLKTAGMLLVLHTHTQSEEVLMSAAAARVPVITITDSAPGDIFVTGESAIVCAPGDIGCVIKGVSTYINNSNLRKQYAEEAERRLNAQVATGADARRLLFRDSLEKAVMARLALSSEAAEVVTTEEGSEKNGEGGTITEPISR